MMIFKQWGYYIQTGEELRNQSRGQGDGMNVTGRGTTNHMHTMHGLKNMLKTMSGRNVFECSLDCFYYAVCPTLYNFHLWYDPACSPSWCHSCERVIHSISFLWTSEGGEKCAPNHHQAELAAIQQLSLSLARWAVLAWLQKNEGPPRNLMQVKRTTKSSFINPLKTSEESMQRSREKMRQHIDTKNSGNGQHPWL